jgi:hypothetical protein
MNDIHLVEIATQSPPTANPVAAFDDAIRDARSALLNGLLEGTIDRLEDASRLAAEVNDPHAHELGNLIGALEPAFETLKLVEMCFLDMVPEQ